MSGPHLHALIGKEIHACKKKLFQRLNAKMDLQTAIARFFCELSEGFDRIVASISQTSQSKGDQS